MKALVGALNQEKSIVGANSVIVKTGTFTALYDVLWLSSEAYNQTTLYILRRFMTMTV